MGSSVRKFIAAVLSGLMTFTPIAALALPQLQGVASGDVQLTQVDQQLLLQQNSSQAVVDWSSFNIGKSESVRIVQPSVNAAILNRIHDQNPSQILGSLSANGQVFLINPHGMVFGANSQVNVHSLLASSHGMSQSNFVNSFANGRYVLDQLGDDKAQVINQGSITVAQAGLAALVAPYVVNNGAIHARLGRVALAAGGGVSIDLAGDQLVRFLVPESALAATLDMDGQINAAGGRVWLTVDQASGLVDKAINMDGVISAQGLTEHNGQIVLLGEAGSTVSVTGTLDVSNTVANQTAGDVHVYGERVGLFGEARVDASGTNDAGNVYVGGNYLGSSNTLGAGNAEFAFMAPDASIDVSASESGDGGRAILWADQFTRFYGAIDARGGAVAGNGGFVETSGKETLDVHGDVLANSRVAGAKAGTWLLDPRNVTIDNAGNDWSDNGDGNENPWSPTQDDATLSANKIVYALNSGSNVQITTGSTGTQDGNIIVSAALAKTSGADSVLYLKAANSIEIEESITSSSGALSVIVHADSDDDGAGNVRIGTSKDVSISTNGGDLTISGGDNVDTGYAQGHSSDNYEVGILMGTIGGAAATITTGVGNITMRGQGRNDVSTGDFHTGITLRGNNTISSTSGLINIVGVAGDGASGSNRGVRIDNGTTISSTTGTITVHGTGASGGSDNHGIRLDSSASIYSASGNIELTGVVAAGSTDNALELLSTASIGTGSSTGNVNFNADSINLLSPITTTGYVAIQPVTDATSIGLDAGAGSLNLSSTELQSISSSVAAITIGSSTGTGLISANLSTFGGFNSQVGLRSNGAGSAGVNLANIDQTNGGAYASPALFAVQTTGAITDSGPLKLTGGLIIESSGSVLLDDAGSDFSNVAGASSGAVTLVDINAFDLGPFTATSLNITATGDITDSGAQVISGNITLNANTTGSVIIDNAGNQFGSIGVTQAKNITIVETGDTNLVGMSASGNVLITSSGSVSVSSALSKTGSDASTFNLLANNNVSVESDISSASGKLHLTLNSDRDANNAGSVNIANTSHVNINTKDGDLVIGGGANPSTTSAYGDSSSTRDGVAIGSASTYAAIQTYAGSISIRGQGHNDATSSHMDGISILGPNTGTSTSIHSTTGTINLVGLGGAGSGGQNKGLRITAAVASSSGAMTLSGTGAGSGGSSDGIAIYGGASVLTVSGAIDITAVGMLEGGSGSGLYLDSTGIIGNDDTTGTISIHTDNMGLSTNAYTYASINTGGAVIIAPITDSATIGLDGGSGDLQLTATELQNIKARTSSITFGKSSGTGLISVDLTNALGFAMPATLISGAVGSDGISLANVDMTGGGEITTPYSLTLTTTGAISDSAQIKATGGLTINGSPSSVVLNYSTNDFSSVGISSSSEVTLVDANGIDLAGITASGLTITAAGDITDSGVQTISGAASFNAGAEGSVTLDDTSNQFSSVAVTQAANVTLVESGDTSIAGIAATGNVLVTSSGGVAITGALAKTGASVSGFDFRANDNVSVEGSISASTGKLNLTFNADRDANSAGSINIAQTSNVSINTNGGFIIMGGGSSPATTAAYGDSSSSKAGVAIGTSSTYGVIESLEGNTSILGHGWNDATGSYLDGVAITGPASGTSTTVRASYGNVNITGVGGTGSSGQNKGVRIHRGAEVISTYGELMITGTGSGTGGASAGVALSDGASLLTISGSIDVTATGAEGNAGLYLDATGNIGDNDTTGAIGIHTDNLYLSSAAYTYNSIKTTGAVTIAPLTNATTIGLDSGAGSLHLNRYELQNISATASSLTIGASTAIGLIDVDLANVLGFAIATTLNNGGAGSGGINLANLDMTANGDMPSPKALTLTTVGAVTDSAQIKATGGLTINGSPSSVVLNYSTNDFSSVGISSSSEVTLVDANGIDLAGITASGLTITAGGNVTDSGSQIIAGAMSLTVTDADIHLDESSSQFGSLAVPSAKDINLVEYGAMHVAGMTASGNVNLQATSINFAASTVAGNVSITATTITNIANVAVSGSTVMNGVVQDEPASEPSVVVSPVETGAQVNLVKAQTNKEVTERQSVVENMDAMAFSKIEETKVEEIKVEESKVQETKVAETQDETIEEIGTEKVIQDKVEEIAEEIIVKAVEDVVEEVIVETVEEVIAEVVEDVVEEVIVEAVEEEVIEEVVEEDEVEEEPEEVEAEVIEDATDEVIEEPMPETMMVEMIATSQSVEVLVEELSTLPVQDQQQALAQVSVPTLVSELQAIQTTETKPVVDLLADTAEGEPVEQWQVKELAQQMELPAAQAMTYMVVHQKMRQHARTQILTAALSILETNPDAADLLLPRDASLGYRSIGNVNLDASQVEAVSVEGADAAGISLQLDHYKVGAEHGIASVTGNIVNAGAQTQLRVNGRWTYIEDDGSFIAKTIANIGVKTVAVQLSNGEHPVTSDEVIIHSEIAGQVEGLLPKAGGKKHALLFGVQDYRIDLLDLKTPVNDVRATAKVLNDLYNYEVQVVENPTQAQMVASIQDLAERLGPDDDLLIYYGGHGYQMPETGEGYWLPSDASVRRPDKWISNADLARFLKRIPARHIQVVSDSCYSGAFAENKQFIASGLSAEQIASRRSVTVLASGGDEPVLDGGGDGHSIFAKHFINSLATQKKPRTGFKVFTEVYEKVSENAPQRPSFGSMAASGHDQGGDYLFTNY